MKGDAEERDPNEEYAEVCTTRMLRFSQYLLEGAVHNTAMPQALRSLFVSLTILVSAAHGQVCDIWLPVVSDIYGNYCGNNRCGQYDSVPVDAVDACCEEHDSCYTRDGGFRPLDCECEKSLIDCVEEAEKDPGEGDEGKEAAAEIISFFSVQPCTCWFDAGEVYLPKLPGQGGICPDENVLPNINEWVSTVSYYMGVYLRNTLKSLSRSLECAECVFNGGCSSDSRCHKNANTIEDLDSSDPTKVYNAVATLFDRIERSRNHEECIDCVGPKIAGIDSDDIVSVFKPINTAVEKCRNEGLSGCEPKTCGWVVWLEECDNSGTLVRSDSFSSFELEMKVHGDEGKHLVAVDVDEEGWMGFFEERPGAYRYTYRSDISDFFDEATQAMNDGYVAEAMAAGDGTHLAWFRKAPVDVSTSTRGRNSALQFREALQEMADKGMHMTAGLGDDEGYFYGWFEESDVDVASRWWHVYSHEDLMEQLDSFLNDGFHVTCIVHSKNDGWFLWGEELSGSTSQWAIRPNRSEMRDYLVDNWEGHCVSDLTYGCE